MEIYTVLWAKISKLSRSAECLRTLRTGHGSVVLAETDHWEGQNRVLYYYNRIATFKTKAVILAVSRL